MEEAKLWWEQQRKAKNSIFFHMCYWILKIALGQSLRPKTNSDRFVLPQKLALGVMA